MILHSIAGFDYFFISLLLDKRMNVYNIQIHENASITNIVYMIEIIKMLLYEVIIEYALQMMIYDLKSIF